MAIFGNTEILCNPTEQNYGVHLGLGFAWIPRYAEDSCVNPVSKPSAVKLAADALRAECAAGKWVGRLPGTRTLAVHLGVSPPTVTAALAKLVEERVLERGGERRAFRVLKKRRGGCTDKSANPVKRLLILSPDDLGVLVYTTRCTVDQLRVAMTAKGWQVDVQVVNFLHVKGVQRSWDRRIEVDQRTSVIAIYGREPLAKWALKRKVRMLFLGGVTGGLAIPLVAVMSAGMAVEALEILTGLGHSRVVMPLCDRAEEFSRRMRESMQVAIEAAGEMYVSSYHNPESSYLQPDVSWHILESVFAQQPPTALVFLDWKELVTAMCFLSRRGLRVPEDVSMILLNDPVEAQWFRPTLARFRFPTQRLVTALVRWLEDESAEVKTIRLSGEFVPGNTIARAKKG